MFTEIEEAIQLVEGGEVEKGLKKLRKLKNKANHQEKYQIAECFVQWGLLDEAKEIIEELLLLYPDEGQLYVLAAEVYVDMDNEDEALDLLNEIKEEDPAYPQALMLMADLYQSQGLDEVAEQKLLEAKKVLPNEAVIDFGLGEFYLSKGDYKKSIPYYRSALKDAQTIGNRNLNLCLAEALSMSGKFEEALHYYEEGLNDKVEIHALFGYAFTAFQVEKYQLAIAKWEELKSLDPEYPALYMHLARAYEHEGALPEAYDTAKEGLDVDEMNKELMLYTAKLGLKMNRKDEAESFLREAISLDPGYIEAITTLTKVLLQEQRYEEVIECINHSIEYGEYDPHFEWDLAFAKNELEQFSESFKHFEKAYPFFKDNTEFLEQYAYFLVEEGQREKAREIFKRILQLDPS